MFYLEFSFNHIYLFVSYRMHLAQIRHNILINPLVLAVFRLPLIPNKIEKRKLNINKHYSDSSELKMVVGSYDTDLDLHGFYRQNIIIIEHQITQTDRHDDL